MANEFQNIPTDERIQLSEPAMSALSSVSRDETKMRKPYGHTSMYNPNEIDNITTDYIDELIKQSISPPVSGLQRSDIFPSADTPVTQQGYSGQTFSAPTIAPTGGLFPFALLQERKAAQAQSQARQAKALATEFPELLDLKNLEENRDWNETGYQGLQEIYRKGEEESMRRYGSKKYAGKIVEQEASRYAKKRNDIAKLYNQGFDLAFEITSAKDKSVYPEAMVKDAEMFYKGLDLLKDNPNDEKAMNDLYSAVTKMTGQHKNVDEFTTLMADNVGKRTMLYIENLRKAINESKGGGAKEYDVLRSLTAEGQFLKTDGDGNFSVDQDALAEYLRPQYSQMFKGAVMPDITFEDLVKQTAAKLDQTIEADIKTIEDDDLWKKYVIDKKTREDVEGTYTPQDTSIVLKTSSGDKSFNFTDSYAFDEYVDKKPFEVEIPAGAKLIDENGNEFTSSQIIKYKPDQIGSLEFKVLNPDGTFSDRKGRYVTGTSANKENEFITVKGKDPETGKEITTKKKLQNLLIPKETVDNQFRTTLKGKYINAEESISEPSEGGLGTYDGQPVQQDSKGYYIIKDNKRINLK